MSGEWVLVNQNGAERAKAIPLIPPKPRKLKSPNSGMSKPTKRPNGVNVGADTDTNSEESFEARFPSVAAWESDWESNPHHFEDGGEGVTFAESREDRSTSGSSSGNGVIKDRHLSDVSATSAVSAASGARALASHDRYLTAPPIHAYPPPQPTPPHQTAATPTNPIPHRGAWEPRPALRLTTPPVPAPPHLTTAFPPTPQPVSPSPATPATRAKRPPETPKRSPTSPGTYTSWTRAVSIGSDVLPGPPPPTPTDGPPSCPHPQGVHPPQVPLSEIHLPTYAQPAPTEADAAPVHDLVASFEAMSLKGAAFDPFSRSTTDRAPASGTSPAFQLTPPPTAGLRPPDPPTPSLVPLEASADVSLWGSPGLALGSSPSPSPMLVPPSTPLRAPSSYSQRSASFPSPSPGPDRPTISRSARTTPFQSPFVSSPNSPFFGPHAPALPRPSAEIRNNPSPGLSPWCPAPDSPPLDPIPLPRTWRCSICTLSNTNTTCEACGAVAPQWTCPQCTLHNDHHAVECGACGAANTLLTRPVSPQQLSPTSPLSPLSPLCRTQAKRVEPIEGVGLGIRRGDTDRDIPSAATPNHGSWMCPLCTYGNEPVDKCEMCNTPRP